MNKGLIIGIAIVVVILIALPIIVKGAKSDKSPANTVEPSAQQEAKASITAPPAAPPAATPVGTNPTPTAAPAAAAPGVAITAVTIVGTQWAVKNFVFDFNADGALKVNSMLDGKWSIDGNTLTVSAMGQNLQAKIDGDKITYNGEALVRKK